MAPCEQCVREQGLTVACGYCQDFIGAIKYPVAKAKPRLINIASGEDAGINYVNQDDYQGTNKDDSPTCIYR